ncbi:hypothetical protein BH23BAC2_BH23BAC2_23410 [soil metagenome]
MNCFINTFAIIMSPMNDPEIHNENPANSKEDLLNLIEEGDAFSILSDAHTQGFKDLMKYELIATKDDKVYLTELGKEAQKIGVNAVISRKSATLSIPQIPVKKVVKNRNKFLISVLFLLILILGVLLSQSLLGQ